MGVATPISALSIRVLILANFIQHILIIIHAKFICKGWWSKISGSYRQIDCVMFNKCIFLPSNTALYSCLE